ncbi:MAG: amidase [Gammaproteobacteria bacterium]|nr:amidase [Gammaproteobacteria bacterium]
MNDERYSSRSQAPRPDAAADDEATWRGGPLTRRDVIRATAGVSLVSGIAAGFGRRSDAQPPGAVADLYSSVGALAEGIRRGELSSEALVNACIARIRAVDPALNAVVRLSPDAAVTRAREADAAAARGESWGPLHGVPMTIKDSLDTAGMISTGGTLGRASYVPASDATVVARLRGAGAVLLGKTNTPELTLSFETDNLVHGRTNNPYDLRRTPGGSSGGAAAIVAAGGSPFDIGSDYAGSIRVPAHFCGIAGIKPTAGRVPRTGHAFPFGALQDSYQQLGPLARYVDDLILLLPLIVGPDHVDPGVVEQPWRDHAAVDLRSLRVAFHVDNGVATPEPSVRRAVEVAARAIAPDVLAVEERRPAGIELGFEIGFALAAWDGGSAVRRLLAEAGTREHTLQRFTEAAAIPSPDLEPLIARWYEWRSRMLSFMKDFDVILCPVNAHPAVPHGFTATPDSLAAFSYTVTFNATGWPAAVVRAGTSPEGLPIGVQIAAGPGREDLVLAVAKLIESRLDGFQPPPL